MTENMDTAPLLSRMYEPPLTRPVDPAGPVVQGKAKEVITLPHPKIANGFMARIELHEEGRHWMWSTSHELPCGLGSGYKVGSKWGKLATGREAALHWAVEELIGNVRRADPKSDKGGETIITWAKGLH